MIPRAFGRCVSDADVLIKFTKAGRLDLLLTIMPCIVIPEMVRLETQKKIGLGSTMDVFMKAIGTHQIRVIQTDRVQDLTPEQFASVSIFVQSYGDLMDSGELRAAALASELDIPVMLSDDRNAQSIIQRLTDITVLRVYEVIALGVLVIMNEAGPQESLDVGYTLVSTQVQSHKRKGSR